MPLGFWFANQGSMVTFVILIWTYVWMMNRLDIKYDVHEGVTSGLPQLFTNTFH